MDKEEFLRRYDEGERDFSGVELRDVDLSNAWLSETIPAIGRDHKLILNKAKLINVNFNNAQLRQVDLSEADLSGSNLSNTNLIEANLRDAILTNTDLKCTKLIGADLTGSNINEAINVSSPHLLVLDENKNNNTELVTELRALTRGLYNWHFGIDYPYDVFMWDTESRGDFTLEKFLEAAGFLVEVDPIDFLDNIFPVKEFSFIFQKIKPYIVEREYYYLKISIECIRDNEKIIPILIGKTKTNDWVGVCPVFDMEKRSIDKSGRIEDNTAKKIEHSSLVSILRGLEAV
ncbi:MAG: pentapeptide repeat-containing protein [Cyanobacteria bacterium P01_D01_bin.50]